MATRNAPNIERRDSRTVTGDGIIIRSWCLRASKSQQQGLRSPQRKLKGSVLQKPHIDALAQGPWKERDGKVAESHPAMMNAPSLAISGVGSLHSAVDETRPWVRGQCGVRRRRNGATARSTS